MLEWLSPYIGTVLVCVALAAVFALLIRSLVRDKKKGKPLCGGQCGSCAMGCHCHSTPPTEGDCPEESDATSPKEANRP